MITHINSGKSLHLSSEFQFNFMAFGRKSPRPASKSQGMVTELSVRGTVILVGQLQGILPLQQVTTYLHPFLCFFDEVIVLFDHQHTDPKFM